MPELPEVETVRRGLAQVLTGKVIKKVVLHRKALRLPITPGFAKRVEGRCIKKIERRAKYLLFTLDDGQIILAHLGMSGRMMVHASMPKKWEKHDHVALIMEDDTVLIFNDARRFGIFLLIENDKLPAHPLLREVGPEPLEKTFDAKALAQALKKRKGPIKSALMDQKLVAGLGNIYASEALFHAGIRPTRPAFQCARQAEKLVNAIREVLNDAIASGGSTLRDYVRSNGDIGHFQHHFAVYERSGERCEKCRTIIRRIVQAGRSTYYCPRCQK